MLGVLRREVSMYLERVGVLQSEILLSLVYIVVVAPIWIVLRATRRRLLDAPARWRRPRDGRPTLATMREPY
jgi:hypothetical protein